MTGKNERNKEKKRESVAREQRFISPVASRNKLRSLKQGLNDLHFFI